jgi:hypothetical protein
MMIEEPHFSHREVGFLFALIPISISVLRYCVLLASYPLFHKKDPVVQYTMLEIRKVDKGDYRSSLDNSRCAGSHSFSGPG